MLKRTHITFRRELWPVIRIGPMSSRYNILAGTPGETRSVLASTVWPSDRIVLPARNATIAQFTFRKLIAQLPAQSW